MTMCGVLKRRRACHSQTWRLNQKGAGHFKNARHLFGEVMCVLASFPSGLLGVLGHAAMRGRPGDGIVQKALDFGQRLAVEGLVILANLEHIPPGG